MKNLIHWASAIILSSVAGSALAEDAAPAKALSVSASISADLWNNSAGGIRRGGVVLTTADAVIDLDGAAVGLEGWTAQASMVATNGKSLSALVGDLQTASNIENDGSLHLYEAWVRRSLGDKAAVKVGILDLNADFDTNDTAALFLNSAHGVGPDISGSGQGAPVWPLGAAGVQMEYTPSADLILRAGVYNGVPRDPDHPRAFAAATVGSDDGVIAIAQGDWTSAAGVRWSAGLWHQSADLPAIDPAATAPVSGQTGVYGTVEGPVAGMKGLRGWLRLGAVDDETSALSHYVGSGLVKSGLLASRPDDAVGLSIAHARLGGPLRHAAALAGTPLAQGETAIELTYAAQIHPGLAIQPDLQYIIHPGGDSALDDALLIGVRVTLSTF
jgi:porin